jgi:hypothetical protein
MCDLILAFRQQAEPDSFGVPHSNVPQAIDFLRSQGCTGPFDVRFDFWGASSAPIVVNGTELRYIDLDICELYVEEARRAAILAAAKEPNGK